MTGKNRIMIFGPKDDSTYVVEFRTADGEALAISIPRSETAVIRHLQERMPYGLAKAAGFAPRSIYLRATSWLTRAPHSQV
jgi:hypothetical protein